MGAWSFDSMVLTRETVEGCGRGRTGGRILVLLLARTRYKLMSPACLPIACSPCLTISSSLKPSTLLKSPVLFRFSIKVVLLESCELA